MNNEREKMILSFGLVGIVIFGVIALLILTYFAYGLDYFINEIKTLVGFTIGLCIILFIKSMIRITGAQVKGETHERAGKEHVRSCGYCNYEF